MRIITIILPCCFEEQRKSEFIKLRLGGHNKKNRVRKSSKSMLII